MQARSSVHQTAYAPARSFSNAARCKWRHAWAASRGKRTHSRVVPAFPRSVDTSLMQALSAPPGSRNSCNRANTKDFFALVSSRHKLIGWRGATKVPAERLQVLRFATPRLAVQSANAWGLDDGRGKTASRFGQLAWFFMRGTFRPANTTHYAHSRHRQALISTGQSAQA